MSVVDLVFDEFILEKMLVKHFKIVSEILFGHSSPGNLSLQITGLVACAFSWFLALHSSWT